MGHNEVTRFMWYMFNKWNEDEALRVFGFDLGKHIWAKWEVANLEYHDPSLSWYADLDEKCRSIIIKRANEIYKDV